MVCNWFANGKIQHFCKGVQDGVQVTEIDLVFWKLVQNLKETRRQMRKRYLSKKSFTYKIYAGTSKAALKVFQQRGASSIREFPFFITCSSLHGHYG